MTSVEGGAAQPVTICEHVRIHAEAQGDRVALAAGDSVVTWADYDRSSTRLGAALLALGFERGEKVAVLLPDGPAVHVAFVGIEKAGLVVVGIGWRAGRREIRHLLGTTGARAIVTDATRLDDGGDGLVGALRADGVDLDHVVVVDAAGSHIRVDGEEAAPGGPERAEVASLGRQTGIEDLFLLNPTSGTTGMPKCVMHNQRRWIAFHEMACDAADLHRDDRFLSVIPAPFGFGIWTAHVTPTLLGSSTWVMERFDALAAIELIEREQITVLAAVSTQFLMMLSELRERGPSTPSLRVLFTGGEAVPAAQGREFELLTGATVLQFYGSNETGALSRTTLRDAADQRLGTAGQVLEHMAVRLFDEHGNDITSTGGPGQPGCRGPVTCLGYYEDEDANDELYTPDGWMLTGDLATIDRDGYLRVVGRISDFIIRGGKNISSRAVEEAVSLHPDVHLVAVVAMPDQVLGERTCAFVTLRSGAGLELVDLLTHLEAHGVSKELWPERLEVVDRLPESSGGKVSKVQLRERIGRLGAPPGGA